MGLIKCEKHKHSVMCHVCSHISAVFFSEKQTDKSFFQLRKDTLESQYYLCNRCVSHFKLDSVDIIEIEELVRILDELDENNEELHGVCCRCFKEKFLM